MMKPATVAFMFLAMCPGHAHSEPMEGKPVPFFPKLTWGLNEQAALTNGLKTYTKQNAKADVIGLPSITIGDIDFSAQVVFGKKDISDVRSGLNYVVLQHVGYVPRGKYEKFIRLITSGFLYAGRASAVNESAVFFNSINRDNNLVVTTSNGTETYLGIAIAPGISK